MSRLTPLAVIDLHTLGAATASRQPLCCGLPLPPGHLRPEQVVAIQSPDAVVYPCQSRPLALWPDGSCKWLLIDALIDPPAQALTSWQLFNPAEPPVSADLIQINQGPETWVVTTGVGEFHLDTRTLRPFIRVVDDQGDCLAAKGSRSVFSADGTTLADLSVDSMVIENPGPLVAVIKLEGQVDAGPLQYRCRLTFNAGSLRVGIHLTLHNPQAAVHPGGLWDLGDSGSVFFKQLSLVFPLPAMAHPQIIYRTEPGQAPMTSDSTQVAIYQEASGGSHWNSPNHRNQQGEVPMTVPGYILEEEGTIIATGSRAQPVLWCGQAERGIKVTLPHFWQQFPKQLLVAQHRIQIDLFPARFPDAFELQGGERKTHEVVIDFSAPSQSSAADGADLVADPVADLVALPSMTTVHASGVFGDLPGPDDLVDQFTSVEQMKNKRELIDEYGWRHFGDVYADHEAVNHQGKEPFVSHYNNQYDLLAGCYRKALASGDPGWWQLAFELAGHVLDSDIYHTDQDREEYNHGLFWHTDHYAPAGLATHRSYSKEQQGAYALHAGGGGPGAEHCYTSGLKLHYYFTGNPDVKQAVIALAKWELLALKGPQTLLATLKRGVDYLRSWRTAAGQQQLFPRYPLTRGSGNALVACLDAYELSSDPAWLNHAADIIAQALHPSDDIALRRLENIEIAWSYLVLLQSIAKFLDKKHELGQYDEAFHHARLSLLHYAKWMLANEYPYLDKPEILEYPNETWAAQELRKAVVFYQAARYSDNPQQQQAFQHQARFFYQTAQEQLTSFTTSTTTRPVALMLQNGWIGTKLAEQSIKPVDCPASELSSTWKPIPNLTLAQIGKRLATETLEVLKVTSIKREVAWLKARIKP